MGETLKTTPASMVCEPVAELNPDEIKAIRKKMGLSQFAFAVRLGIPLSTIRSWEGGWRKPRASGQSLLKRVLGEAESV